MTKPQGFSYQELPESDSRVKRTSTTDKLRSVVDVRRVETNGAY